MYRKLTDERDLLDTPEDLFGPSFFIVLRNFDLNSNALKVLHRQVLREHVRNFVKRRVGFAEIYAMTDRTGSRQVNYQVSGWRLSEVQQFLLRVGAPPEKIMHLFAKAIGEDFWELRYNEGGDPETFKDGRNAGEARRVVIALTPAPIGRPTKIFRTYEIAHCVTFCRLHEQKP